MSDAVNPWKELFGVDTEENFIMDIVSVNYWTWFELTDDLKKYPALVQRLAKMVTPPVETVFRHAWDYGVIDRPEGVTVELAWSLMTPVDKAKLDLFRASVTAALTTARQHVAEFEARQVTAAAIARPPVPVEDTIFERHGSTFERDPVLAAAVDAQFADSANMVGDQEPVDTYLDELNRACDQVDQKIPKHVTPQPDATGRERRRAGF